GRPAGTPAPGTSAPRPAQAGTRSAATPGLVPLDLPTPQLAGTGCEAVQWVALAADRTPRPRSPTVQPAVVQLGDKAGCPTLAIRCRYELEDRACRHSGDRCRPR